MHIFKYLSRAFIWEGIIIPTCIVSNTGIDEIQKGSWKNGSFEINYKQSRYSGKY